MGGGGGGSRNENTLSRLLSSIDLWQTVHQATDDSIRVLCSLELIISRICLALLLLVVMVLLLFDKYKEITIS